MNLGCITVDRTIVADELPVAARCYILVRRPGLFSAQIGTHRGGGAQPGGGLGVPALAFQRAAEHELRVELDRVTLDDRAELLLGAAELRGVVVAAGQQQARGHVLGDLFDDFEQEGHGGAVVLRVEQQLCPLPLAGYVIEARGVRYPRSSSSKGTTSSKSSDGR